MYKKKGIQHKVTLETLHDNFGSLRGGLDIITSQLQNLAHVMESRFLDLDHRIEDLTHMTADGFAHVQKQLDDHTKLFEIHDERLSALEIGQERILMRLDNVAYKFELQELNQRLERVEKRVGI